MNIKRPISILIGIVSMLLGTQLVTAQESPYDYASFIRETNLTIPNAYTPFGNFPSFGRVGDDGSRCVADPNGVLTWIDSTGVVRLLPNTELATPMFVTDTECVVWNNRFVDYTDAYSRPNAEIVYFRAVAGSSAVTSQVISTQGTEVVATSPITTSTSTLNFITVSRKTNDQTADVMERRVYRLTFNGGVQLLSGTSGYVIRDAAAGVKQDSVAFGSDGSIMFHIDDQLFFTGGGYIVLGDIYYWVNSSGGVYELPYLNDPFAVTIPDYFSDGFNRCIFLSNTRLVFEKFDLTTGDPEIWDLRRSSTGNTVIANSEITGVVGTTLDSSVYTIAGAVRYFYTVDPAVPDEVRTYQLSSAGVNVGFTRVHTLPNPVSAATVVGAVNPTDGAAFIFSEDGAESVWLHSGAAPDNISVIPNSSQVKPLYVTDEQCALWENARAPLSGNGAVPPADLIHYLRDTGTNALTPTDVFVEGGTVFNTLPYTPDFQFWLVTTAEKTTPDTAIIRTYRLTDPVTTDRDNDGLPDAYETDTGIYVSETNTGSDPTDPDTDDDGRLDGDEVFPYVIVNGSYTWAEADADAQLRGGHLATIAAAIDDEGLRYKFEEDTFFTLWLGATDEVTENSFVWVTGEAFGGFTNWAPGKPDNLLNSDGLVLEPNFEWSDKQLSSTRGYLLELPTSDPNIADTDGDGLDDGEEIGLPSDPNLVDTDGDGLTDLEERDLGTNPVLIDTDGDTITDFEEVNTTVPFVDVTDPLKSDTDDDGLDDLNEYVYGTDPNVIDTDADGLSDGEEVFYDNPFPPGIITDLDPTDSDTDDDGLNDGDEVLTHGTDPLVVDTDGDTVSDFDEVTKGSDPLDPQDPISIDSDGDGLTDYDELFVHGTDPNDTDTDDDGISDYDEVQNGTDPLTGVPPITPDDNNTGSPVPFGNNAVSTTYAGLVYDPTQGHVYYQDVRVSSRGSFSSKIGGLSKSIRGRLKGSFNSNGYYFSNSPTGLPDVTSVELQMWDEGGGSWIIRGQMETRGGDIIGIELRPVLYGRTGGPCPYPSNVTIALESTDIGAVGPRGDGVAVGAIDTRGNVKLKMYLPDGARASFKGEITSTDVVPIYSIGKSSYNPAIIGPMDCVHALAGRDFSGALRYYSNNGPGGSQYPGGFDQTRDLNGSVYRTPTRGFKPVNGFPASEFNALFNLLGGEFGGSVKVSTWNSKDKFVFPRGPSDNTKFKYQSKTGLFQFKHTTTDPDLGLINATSVGYAVAVQESDAITGFYDSGASNGQCTVTPNDSGVEPEITVVSPRNKSIVNTGGVYYIEVRTSADWEIVLPTVLTPVAANEETGTPEYVPWATFEIVAGGTGGAGSLTGSGDGTIKVTVSENDEMVDREATIEVAGINHRISQDYY